MYVRIIFSAPIVALLSLRSGVFSKKMTLIMAIPSLIFCIAGMFVFTAVDGRTLKLVLGYSCLVFAAIYFVALVVNFVRQHPRLRRTRAAPTRAEVDAEEWNAARECLVQAEKTPAPIPSDTSAIRAANAPWDDGAGVCVQVTSAAASTMTAAEAEAVPRRNRNFDEHGKIKTSTKVCAGVASALSGVMGSLTGVGAPPQIIFILLLDVPNSIIRINFCLSSIPSAAFRFIMACSKPLLSVEMIPMLVTSVLSGYAGIYAGYRLGQIFGPRSYSVFVLLLLIVASLIMMTTNLIILLSSIVLMVVVTTITAVYERLHTPPPSPPLADVDADATDGPPTLVRNTNREASHSYDGADADTVSGSHGSHMGQTHKDEESELTTLTHSADAKPREEVVNTSFIM